MLNTCFFSASWNLIKTEVKKFLRLWTITDELEASCGVSKETLKKKKRGTLKGHKKKRQPEWASYDQCYNNLSKKRNTHSLKYSPKNKIFSKSILIGINHWDKQKKEGEGTSLPERRIPVQKGGSLQHYL